MNPFLRMLRKINAAVEAAAKGVSLTLAALITLFVFASIVSRNFFSHSFEYSVDANQLMFMWMCFLGIVAVHSMGAMLKFEMLEKRTPASLRPWLNAALNLVTLAIAAIMVVAGAQMLDFAKSQKFSTISVTYFWMYLPVPLAGACIFLKALERLLGSWKKEAGAC